MTYIVGQAGQWVCQTSLGGRAPPHRCQRPSFLENQELTGQAREPLSVLRLIKCRSGPVSRTFTWFITMGDADLAPLCSGM